jgi:hypothetical protein
MLLVFRIYKYILTCIIVLTTIVIFSVIWNINKLKISHDELIILNIELGSIIIRNEEDIKKIQNKIIHLIDHKFLSKNEINLHEILKNKKGLCYDRSFILQKIFIYNKIPIRPVFIFYKPPSAATKLIDFLKKDIPSHNVFEFKWNNKWYLMRTNTKLIKFQSLDEYIQSGEYVPKSSKYIKYINNRNGRFISPSWIPDIYFTF